MNHDGQCRSCGARVRWVKTASNKPMPLNPDPVADGNLVMDDDVNVRAFDPLFDAALPRFTSHFADCPQGKTWRKK